MRSRKRGLARNDDPQLIEAVCNSFGSYTQGNFATILEEPAEPEMISRRRELRRRSTVVDGRNSKLTGAIELNLQPMLRTQGPDSKEMKIKGVRANSVLRETGKRSQNERYNSP